MDARKGFVIAMVRVGGRTTATLAAFVGSKRRYTAASRAGCQVSASLRSDAAQSRR